MGYSERQRQEQANLKYMEYRMGLTPKDNWEGNEDGYINYLLGIDSYEWVNGKLKTIRGSKSIEKHFYDYLEDDSFSCYHQCRAHGYYDWMLKVKERYLELKAQGKLK